MIEFTNEIKSQLKYLANSGSFFIYDLDWLEQHVQRLAVSKAKIFYACKANPLKYILQTVQDAKLSFDVASTGELQHVLDIGVMGDKIIMTGPAKPSPLLELGLVNKVGTYVIESLTQLQLLEEFSIKYDYIPNILIRLQLQWDNNIDGVIDDGKITSFGVDLKTAAKILKQSKLPILGFHVFQWGNILSIKTLEEIWTRSIEICKTLKSDFEIMDVGGGLGIPYSGEQELEWDEILPVIQKLKQTYKLKDIWLEIGRYVAGPCGFYITKVIDRKITYDTNILVVAGGINHLARPALVKEAFPIATLKKSNATNVPFQIYGPLCTSLDYFGNHLLPSDIKINDVLVFKQVGAYGFTESMPYFLCHELPGEAVIKNGKLNVVRRAGPPTLWL